MKNLWQVFVYAKEHGMEEEEIFLDIGLTCSPYAEVTLLKGISCRENPAEYHHVAANPFCSHEQIFSHLLKPDGQSYSLLLRAISDMILHHLAKLDALSYMTRKDFYLKFIYEDLEHAAYGGREIGSCFTVREIKIIARFLYRLYETCAYEKCFLSVMEFIYPSCMICTTGNKQGFLFLNCKKEPMKEEKIDILITLFTQADSHYDIYWDVPPAVVGEAWMEIGNIILAD